MSKTNRKDRRNDQSLILEKQYEELKRQLLDYQFTLKKLQQRIKDFTQENVSLRKKIEESAQNFSQVIEQLSIKNMANQKRLLSLSNQKTKLQIENEQKQNKIKSLQKTLFEEQQSHLKDIEQSRKNIHFQQAKYQSQLSEYKFYMNERDQLNQERQNLKEKIEIQKANRLREIADKQREKVQATDKIKEEMNFKIKEMEKNMVSLKKEQLQTATRLTILQNHQLTTQLEYQSKQTEKLIFKNQELEQKLITLKQQIDIHKEVQDQLAKRSHISQGIIRKLNLRINQLASQMQTLKSSQNLSRNIQEGQGFQKQFPEQSSERSLKDQLGVQNQSQRDKKLIQSLCSELEKSDKKYIELLRNYEILSKEKDLIQKIVNAVEKKANQLYKVLDRYYHDVLMNTKSRSQILNDKNDFLEQNKQNSLPYQLNLDHLRDLPVQRWKIDDLVVIVQILLNIIQPYLIRSNLIVPSVRKNLILADGLTQRIYDSSLKSLPKLNADKKQKQQNHLHYGKSDKILMKCKTKLVLSNLKSWGPLVPLNNKCIKRKYKIPHTLRT